MARANGTGSELAQDVALKKGPHVVSGQQQRLLREIRGDTAWAKKFRERFFDRVHPEPMSGCHLWAGSSKNGGYGVVGIKRDKHMAAVAAHRIAYVLAKGEIPEGNVVRHRCDNPPCVNPDHLEVGTQQDNVDDMIRRGRADVYGMAKLSPSLVERIRRAYRKGGVTQKELAAEFGVTQPAVYYALHGKTWAVAPGERLDEVKKQAPHLTEAERIAIANEYQSAASTYSLSLKYGSGVRAIQRAIAWAIRCGLVQARPGQERHHRRQAALEEKRGRVAEAALQRQLRGEDFGGRKPDVVGRLAVRAVMSARTAVLRGETENVVKTLREAAREDLVVSPVMRALNAEVERRKRQQPTKAQQLELLDGVLASLGYSPPKRRGGWVIGDTRVRRDDPSPKVGGGVR